MNSHCLGSGFIIFKGGKQGMQEARRCPMRTLFYLSESQLERKLFFPRSHGAPRVDDRRVSAASSTSSSTDFSGKDAPDEYGPHNPLYNRFVR